MNTDSLLSTVVRSGAARVGLSLGLDIDEALADPRCAVTYLPRVGRLTPTRLLLSGQDGRLSVFRDSGTRWSDHESSILERTRIVGEAAFKRLARRLDGVILEVWLLASDQLMACDILGFAGEDVRSRPLSERLILLRQVLEDGPLPGDWYRPRSSATAPVDSPDTDHWQAMARRLDRAYGGRASNWLLALS